MNKLEIYSEIAESFNISREQFEEEILSEGSTQETLKYFDMVASMGVASYPTVIVVEGSKGTIISQGYSSFEDLDRIFSTGKFSN